MSGFSTHSTPYPEGASDAYIAQWSVLPRCNTCERPIRPVGTKAREWPSTMAYGTSSQCKSCYNQQFNRPMTAATANKMGMEVKKVKRRSSNRDGVKEVLVAVKPRQAVAEGWSPERRSAALLVCDVAGNAADASELMEILGFFEPELSEVEARLVDGYLVNFRNPKGTGGYNGR